MRESFDIGIGMTFLRNCDQKILVFRIAAIRTSDLQSKRH